MTLIELIISISIIVLITTIIFVTMAGDRSHREAKLAAAKFQAALQDAQNKAQSGQSAGNHTGYGVLISALNNNFFETCGDTTATPAHKCDEIISRIAIQESAKTQFSIPAPPLEIVYTLPNGKVYINNVAAATAKVVFADKKGQYCYALTVTGAGTISKPVLDPSCT